MYDVIRQVAAEGRVVIVAHAASIPLAGMDGLLRVLVTASPKDRAARVAVERNLDWRAAAKAVQDSDHEREQYLRHFYQVQQESALHYDLVINRTYWVHRQRRRPSSPPRGCEQQQRQQRTNDERQGHAPCRCGSGERGAGARFVVLTDA